MSYFHVSLLLGASSLCAAAAASSSPAPELRGGGAELPGDLFDSDEEYDKRQPVVSLLQTSISLIMKDSHRNPWSFEDTPVASDEAHVRGSSPFICGAESQGLNSSWPAGLELNYSRPSTLELFEERVRATQEAPVEPPRVEALCDVLGEPCDDELLDEDVVAYSDVASIQLSAQAYSL